MSDIRIVESMATSGGLKDPVFRLDPNIENISLVWNQENENLTVVDYNLDYFSLPFYHSDPKYFVKKVFLTYNGKNKSNGELTETVLMESANGGDLNQIPGYNNSNEWIYNPKSFSYNPELRNLTNPADYANLPFDYSQGFTVVKQFLTSQANLTPGTPAYTAFYRAPHLTSFLPTNVDNNRIYVDGWYTSYVIACKSWYSAGPTVNGTFLGDILFFDGDNQFYVNITGSAGTTSLTPDLNHWKPNPSFTDWTNLMRANRDVLSVDSSIQYIETQHLVTAELNSAILKELKCQCSCCDKPDFNTSKLLTYMKLMQKRLGAYVQFNAEIFHEASCIIESSRQICSLCLYSNSAGGCC